MMSSIIEDCIDALVVIPPGRRFGKPQISSAEMRARTLCTEARTDFERIEPLVDQFVRAMVERG